MYRDQYTKQMYALERSKVTSMAKTESDNAIAGKPGMVNNPNEYAGRMRHRRNTFFGARYSILPVSGTPQQNYKMPATFKWF